MLQGCQHKVVTILLYQQLCNKSGNFDKVVTSCHQVVPNLLTTGDKQCEYILLTACWQTCYNLCVFTCVVVGTRLMALSDLLQGCSNKSDTVMI